MCDVFKAHFFSLHLSFLHTQDPGRIRDSRSTLVGGGGLDYLGRPVLNNSSRRGRENRAMDREEENRLRVESYVRNSTMSLVSVCERHEESRIAYSLSCKLL